ncbi:hypothetical protein BDV18DRAFT_160088 [Aspergillus unguis]
MAFRPGSSGSISFQRVLDFWFGPKSSASYLQPKPFWYGSPADDAVVAAHLEPAYHSAAAGHLSHWVDPPSGSAESALALILLLDQVPRNIFRGTPQAYATDQQAVSVARAAVERGWDRDLPDIMKRYMYSPFNHSEELADQEESVRLFTQLGDPYHLRFAKDFHDAVKRDGRFKHRDRILGR